MKTEYNFTQQFLAQSELYLRLTEKSPTDVNFEELIEIINMTKKPHAHQVVNSPD